jgi:cbb3-type cytochrome c oxidase subunit II
MEGRDIFIREGCTVCHSQMIRPFRHEETRYGTPSNMADSMFDHPFQWGSKRTGPDLAREGGKYPNLWHVKHLTDPLTVSPGSNMPTYEHLSKTALDLESAYAVQSASISRRLARGERQVGLKMGFTSRAKMIQMGVSDMIWGRLTDQMLVEDGGRISLAVGLAAMVVAVLVGVVIGALAGMSSGRVDAVLMWITDLFLSLPQLPLSPWHSAAVDAYVRDTLRGPSFAAFHCNRA